MVDNAVVTFPHRISKQPSRMLPPPRCPFPVLTGLMKLQNWSHFLPRTLPSPKVKSSQRTEHPVHVGLSSLPERGGVIIHITDEKTSVEPCRKHSTHNAGTPGCELLQWPPSNRQGVQGKGQLSALPYEHPGILLSGKNLGYVFKKRLAGILLKVLLQANNCLHKSPLKSGQKNKNKKKKNPFYP